MVFLCLFALASVATPSPSEAPALARMIREAAQCAVSPAAKDPEDQLYTLWVAADTLQGPHDVIALDLLNQAWKLAAKDGDSQVDVVRVMSAIDPARGKGMIAKIKDEYWRDFAERFYPGYVAERHPRLAARLFKKHNDQDVFETTLDLCEIRLEMGIEFIKMLKGHDTESLVRSVAYNLPGAEKGRLLNAFPIAKPKQPSAYWMDRHPNPTGAQLEAASKTMPELYDRVKLTLEAIKAYRASDPARAALLADGLCDLAAGKEPLPKPAGMSSNLEWKYMLLPDISLADSPKVRKYLDTALKPGDNLQMRLVAAWSNLDIAKATRMADAIIAKTPGEQYGPHGQTIDDGYEAYLTNLVKTDPKDAAKRLAAMKFTPVAVPESSGGMAHIFVIDVIRKLWLQYPEQVREFCRQPGPWSKSLGEKPERIVDFLEIDAKVKADPLNSRPLLDKMADCPSGTFLLGIGHSATTSAAMRAAARTDQNGAIKLSEALKSPSQRCEALLNAFESVQDLPFERRSRLLDSAFSQAKSIQDSRERSMALLSVAGKCRKAWARLQAWPPAQE